MNLEEQRNDDNMGERVIPGLRRKDWILRALLLAVTSLWPRKVDSSGAPARARGWSPITKVNYPSQKIW